MKKAIHEILYRHSLVIGLTIFTIMVVFDIAFIIKRNNYFHDSVHHLAEHINNTVSLSAANTAIARRIRLVSDSISSRDEFGLASDEIDFVRQGAIVTNALTRVATSPEVSEIQLLLLEQVRKQITDIGRARRDTVAYIENGNFELAAAVLNDRLVPAQIHISNLFGDIKELEDAQTVKEMKYLRERIHELTVEFTVMLFFTTALFGVIAIMMFTNVSRRERDLKTEKDAAIISATHDSLTGLPNRQYMDDALEHGMQLADRQKDMLGYMALDLNGFKLVNDTLGHIVGDEALIEAGRRINGVIREADVVARFGGDEFSVMMHGVQGDEDVIRVAERIHEAFRKPFYLRGQAYTIGVSIGIVIYPKHGINVHNILKRADKAMYHSKENKLSYTIYDTALNEQYDERESLYDVTLISYLTDAIERDEFKLVYQPKYDAKSLEVIGVEALLRWNNPELGIVPPGKFIKLAEQIGIINDITLWVIEEGVRQLSEWSKTGTIITMSLNVSARCLHDLRLMDTIANSIVKYNIHPSQLTLELTETALMTNTDSAIKILVGLTVLGVRLSIDDFGTGHSSMMYIQKLPVTEIKIDQSFVIGLANNQRNRKIIKAIIGLAHSIDCIVVAEGVEEEEDLTVLQEMSCDAIQGYYLAKPMDPDNIPGICKE